jgi:hypothetical protein
MNHNKHVEQQYAKLKIVKSGTIKNQVFNNVLVSAQEAMAMDVYADKIIDEPKFDESITRAYVCYGCYIPQSGITKDQAIKNIKASAGYWFGFVLDNKCYPIVIYDVEIIGIISSKNDNDVRFSFAVLIKAPQFVIDLIGGLSVNAVTGFLRLTDMSPAENLLNRNGVFALKGVASMKKGVSEAGDWRELIDISKASSIAKQIK